VDFSGLRPALAQRLGWTSARGWKPFDPVSLFLLLGWQITHRWTRAQTLKNLRDPRYADYAQRFGFQDGVFPTEGGIRYFLTTLGRNPDADGETITLDEEEHSQVAIQRLNQLIAQSVTLIRQTGFLSPQAWDQALICPDGMLHQAASRLRCAAVTDTCYQPTSPDAPRPCPARDKGRQGCTCDTSTCTPVCRDATPRDPEARFVWYNGSNQLDPHPHQPTDSSQADPPRGTGVYGSRSLPVQLADPLRRFSLNLLDDCWPAHDHEEKPVAAARLRRQGSPGMSLRLRLHRQRLRS
jgi:hypothetical protein